MKVTENILGKFSDSVVGYFNLWSYLDVTFKRILAGRSTHMIGSCAEFYHKLYHGEIKHGDRVVLKNFFVTEWVPRTPGALAHLLETKAISETEYMFLQTNFHGRVQSLVDVIPDSSKRDSIQPFGSCRLPIQDKKRIALGAVSIDEYHTDLGIVLSISEPVYSAFVSKQHKDYAVEASIEGYIELLENPKDFPNLPLSITNLEAGETKQAATQAWNTPAYTIKIDSPLQVSFRTHSTHPRMNVWTINRVTYKDPPFRWHRCYHEDGLLQIESHYGGLVDYEYAYVTVTENSFSEFIAARDVIKHLAGNRYVVNEPYRKLPRGFYTFEGTTSELLKECIENPPSHDKENVVDVTRSGLINSTSAES